MLLQLGLQQKHARDQIIDPDQKATQVLLGHKLGIVRYPRLDTC